MYGTYAVPSLLMGYIAAKGLSDKFSQKKLLEEAEKRRAVSRAAKRPAEIYAIPSPQLVEDEEEE